MAAWGSLELLQTAGEADDEYEDQEGEDFFDKFSGWEKRRFRAPRRSRNRRALRSEFDEGEAWGARVRPPRIRRRPARSEDLDR